MQVVEFIKKNNFKQTRYGYYINNNFIYHRDNGPAIETIYENGDIDISYYFHNKLHRLDGYAVICSNKYQCYYINDIGYSEEEYQKAVEAYKLNLICK